MRLVIAEKPSVAMSIAAVLGVKDREEGCISGKEYIVSWCYGHLAELADPAVYDERYAKWRLEDLPILPGVFQYNGPQKSDHCRRKEREHGRIGPTIERKRYHGTQTVQPTV
jgi:DNA topoisomerase IA